MVINVRFSTGLAQHVGRTRLQVTLDEGATIADLRQHLDHNFEGMGQPLAHAIPVLAGRHVTDSEPLQNGQEVSLLLPIAGG
jgi:molybdopterin converting factor small subunit